jgi:inner membrane protein
VPVGDDNRIALRSRWPHPSFAGAFLPNERRVDAQGFEARWTVSSLASDAQRQLRAGDPSTQAVEVSLVDPVDVYTQADRASKYGVLFVLLTFVGFLLFELIRQLRIHPLQYLMVGLALAIFFLLLISLSEHIAFWQAYLVSALACIGLQAVYLANVLGHWKRGMGFALMLTVLYGALYGLLVSENNALLMGSLLLFGILALVMWVTRRVDWYALGMGTPPALPADTAPRSLG